MTGLRVMQHKDINAIQGLLERYLKRFDMTPEFDLKEIEHWLLHDEKSTSEQVIWTYVVEEQDTHKVTDFFSFYCLESSVIGNQKHDNVRAAYLFYYATETAFEEKEKGLRERLNLLILDALILAKKVKAFFPVNEHKSTQSKHGIDHPLVHMLITRSSISMFSTPSPFLTTRCSSKARSLALEMDNYITIFTITGRCPLQAGWMEKTMLMNDKEVVSGS